MSVGVGSQVKPDPLGYRRLASANVVLFIDRPLHSYFRRRRFLWWHSEPRHVGHPNMILRGFKTREINTLATPSTHISIDLYHLFPDPLPSAILVLTFKAAELFRQCFHPARFTPWFDFTTWLWDFIGKRFAFFFIHVTNFRGLFFEMCSWNHSVIDCASYIRVNVWSCIRMHDFYAVRVLFLSDVVMYLVHFAHFGIEIREVFSQLLLLIKFTVQFVRGTNSLSDYCDRRNSLGRLFRSLMKRRNSVEAVVL